MNKFREYIKMASQIARRLTRAGLVGEIKEELARLATRLGIDDAMAKQANRVVSAETAKMAEQFVEEKFVPAPAIKALSAKIPAMRQSFDKGVFEIVRRAVARGETDGVIEDRIARLGRTEERHVATLSNTIQIGIARQGAMEQAEANGAKYFRYTGAAMNARPFCKARVGKVYPMDEIRKMDNRQGLPVEHFCGGYNCRHRWVAVNQGETTVEKGAKPKPHEIETANKLNRQGISVDFVKESKEAGVKMYDATIDKTYKAEFKSARNVKNQTNHLFSRMKEAEEKKAEIMVLDISLEDYDPATMMEVIKTSNKRYSALRKILFLKDGKIVEFII